MSKIKVNSDGSNSSDGVITKAAVIIHGYGEYIELGLPGYSDIAEYSAIRLGLKKLIELNLQNEDIDWFNDSQFVMMQMSGKWKMHKRSYYDIAVECSELKKQFKNISFSWIPREQNTEADALSKL